MYDCFNMAYQDNANALQLHIKVNTENLFPISQKYNAGSLRIPADPSWPKIPQRKLADDIIEPPCVVKLTGSSRSRTVIQTPLNQSPKSMVTRDSAYSSFHHQKTSSSMHTLKRLPGYVDPRFKKVTNVKKNQEALTEPLGKEHNVMRTMNRSAPTNSTKPLPTEEMEKSVPERDTNTQQVKVQEAEKPDEVRKTETNNSKTDCNEKNYSIKQEQISQQKYCINRSESKKVGEIKENICKNKILGTNKCEQNCCKHMSKTIMNDANTQVEITPPPVQDKNGQLFFTLDKEIQSHPLNAIYLDKIAMPQECVHQCCNVQVPVLTYQNVPVQVSTAATNDVIQQCVNHSKYKTKIGTASLIMKESHQCVNSSNIESSWKQCTEVTSNQIQNGIGQNSEEKHICESEKKHLSKVQCIVPNETKENKFEPDDISSIKHAKCLVNPNIPQQLENTKNPRKQEESSDSEYYIPNTIKRNVHNSAFQQLEVKKIMCDTSAEETTDSEFIMRRNTRKKEFTDINKFTTKVNRTSAESLDDAVRNSAQNNDRTNLISKEKNEYFRTVPQSDVTVTDQDQPCQKHETILCEAKAKNKSEQNLCCEKDECIKKLCRNSEPYITYKQKKVSAKSCRKARSYFQKNSHSALIDSDYTLVWPNCQYGQCKHSQTNVHKLSNQRTKESTNERNTNAYIGKDSNLVQENYLKSDEDINSCQEVLENQSKTCLQKECCKCETSPRTNTDDTIERKGISPKTQELLNKSYWEYYNKLRHKINGTGNMEQHICQLATGTSEPKKGKPDEACSKEFRNQLKRNPELQTLQQCSALSSMINKALDSNLQSDSVQTKQLYLNGSMKASPDPVTGMQNTSAKKVAPNPSNVTPNKMRCKMDKKNDKQFLELKSIIFFGGMMYILIIFLPMLYDYLYHEEYDDYENLSYLELIVEYVVSSFKEAFGDVFNGAKQIFFSPVKLRMKS